MKKLIHVNRNTLASNKKHGKQDAPIRIQMGSRVTYAHRVEVEGPSTFVYEEQNPLSCGARVWIETEAAVVAQTDEGPVRYE
jgi:hypothetical protein